MPFVFPHKIGRVASVILIASAVAGCNSPNREQGGVIASESSPQNANPTPAPTKNPTPAPTPSTPSGNDVVARIGDMVITRAELEKPLLVGYGLNMLAKVALRDMARDIAQKQGLNVTPELVAAESQRYLATLFNEEKDPVLKEINAELEKAKAAKDAAKVAKIQGDLDRERFRLLEQLLQQQKVSRADFDLFIETNTYLRAIAEAALKKTPVTDDALREAFNLLYGEKVEVLDIQLANLNEATEAKRRLATEPFEKVAHDMSRDPQTSQMGGKLPAFSRDTPGFPQVFKDVAFSLKVGEVSGPTEAGGATHIIMLQKRIPPTGQKFEDVKESVRQFLLEKQLDASTKALRARIQQDIGAGMQVEDPILKEQFAAQTSRQETEVQDKNDIRRELDRRLRAATQPATAPATPPTTRPTTMPSR